MNRLSSSERAHILQLLCEGMSIRAIERTTSSSKHTISNLLNDAGAALGAYQDQAFRNLQCKQLWEMADLIAVLEASEEAPKKRGPYKSRGATN